MFNVACSIEQGCATIGKWANVNNHYLGLSFKIRGKIHYGWARLSVAVQQDHKITATLTGYAYETIPKKEIHAGQTQMAQYLGQMTVSDSTHDLDTLEAVGPISGPASRILQPASLGRLARGTQYVPVGRRP
jgi:hypothetical protein